ncbi:MAG TPA: hypothetical protein VN706_12435 [Gemmatimonadaceae bacterium]|nr:hypothetical protein [Gemmatimonadaceae bacterium]
MTIMIGGTNIAVARATTIASERFTDATNRNQLPLYYFDQFCLDFVIAAVNTANSTFVGTSEYLADLRTRLTTLDTEFTNTRTAWLGRTNPGWIRFSQIPAAQQPGARNLIVNNLPAPGADRGVHNTNPVAAGGGTVREFDLTAAHDGRMTRRVAGPGRRGYYFSRHHAAAQYEYLLVTDSRGRPLLRNLPAADPIPEVPCP